MNRSRLEGRPLASGRPIFEPDRLVLRALARMPMMQSFLGMLADIRTLGKRRPRIPGGVMWLFTRYLRAHPTLRRLAGERLFSAAHYSSKRDPRQLCLIPASNDDRVFVEEICRASQAKRSFVYKQAVMWDGSAFDRHRFRYVVVRTILLSGTSLREARSYLEGQGFPVKKIPFLVLIDCERGVREVLNAEGIEVRAAYRLGDILAAIRDEEFLNTPF